LIIFDQRRSSVSIKLLIDEQMATQPETTASESMIRANQAARRLIQTYLEHRSSRRMRALDLIDA